MDSTLAHSGIHILPALKGAAVLALVAILVRALVVTQRPYVMPKWTKQERIWLQVGLGIFVTCFVIGYNYDYRYIFLLLPLPALNTAIQQKGWRSIEGLIAATAFPMFWMAWDFEHVKVGAVHQIFCWVFFALSVRLLLWTRQAQGETKAA